MIDNGDEFKYDEEQYEKWQKDWDKTEFDGLQLDYTHQD